MSQIALKTSLQSSLNETDETEVKEHEFHASFPRNFNPQDINIEETKKFAQTIAQKCTTTSHTEFFQRFLNSNGKIRHLFAGRRVNTNSFTKFYTFLLLLEHIDEFINQNGSFYYFAERMMQRHHIYKVEPQYFESFAET